MIVIWLLLAFGAGFFVAGRLVDRQIAPTLEKMIKGTPELLENFRNMSPDKQTAAIAEMKKMISQEFPS